MIEQPSRLCTAVVFPFIRKKEGKIRRTYLQNDAVLQWFLHVAKLYASGVLHFSILKGIFHSETGTL